MRSFFVACLAVIVLAVIGVVALNSVQEASDQAFATHYVRLGA